MELTCTTGVTNGGQVPAIADALRKLLAYCRADDWAGHDPYDALNSPIFEVLPVLNHRVPRIVLTQALRRSPVNVRGLLRIPKRQNPKAMALFLSAFLVLERAGITAHGQDINRMIERLRELRSPGEEYWCWGYSFPWQGRTVLVPAGAANLVSTVFVANALIDAYEQGHGSDCLEMATSAARYIVDELYWEQGGAAGFSYPLRSLRSEVHNANFLAAALLARIYRHTGDNRFARPSMAAARYSMSKQKPDGSWAYGEAPSQAWIDNFHTGYNLCALRTLGEFMRTGEFDNALQRGFSFYRTHFLQKNGAVRYFHDRDYPIDIHCVAQSVLTLLAFRHADSGCAALAQKVLGWAMEHMWDQRGFFYYRVLRVGKIRTSYMRWSQAWMALALAVELEAERSAERNAEPAFG